ncbi:hypothetical protein [Acidithiobacillus sp.]|uniref:hypothetical protein n=1 Tax=Acidithiobacillus sp. TaxID=1872118 RepID=UPI002622709D|nr:hypothetical protein [Acidithiobacillus sp.]MDD5280612.1 hypothetical protein [Acidithiobacillus sp.]
MQKIKLVLALIFIFYPVYSNGETILGISKPEKIPSVIMNIPSGVWAGKGSFDTNGAHVDNVKVKVCIKTPSNFLREKFGGKEYNEYLPRNCAMELYKNTHDLLSVRSICVPFPLIGSAVNFYNNNNNSIKGFSDYIKSKIEIQRTKYGIAYHAETVHEKTFKAKNSVKHKTSSTSETAQLYYLDTPCPKPIKIPTNEELKKEGKNVPSNASLFKDLTKKLGHNPFDSKTQ